LILRANANGKDADKKSVPVPLSIVTVGKTDA
jgi:hypothetical protein